MYKDLISIVIMNKFNKVVFKLKFFGDLAVFEIGR